MTTGARLPPWHLLLALLVTAVWGTNFVVIHGALEAFTPLWLATMRFALALLPIVLLAVIPGVTAAGARSAGGWLDCRRPDVPWRDMLAYGALVGAGQFGLLFTAMNGHISPGLASLVIQTQVFFTIGLSMATAGERVRPVQVAALLLAASGLVLIAMHADGRTPTVGGEAAPLGVQTTPLGVQTTPPGVQTTPLGVAMVVLAAFCWACGNLVARRAKGVSALGYVVWSSLGAVPLLAVLAWRLEGPQALLTALPRAGVAAWTAVVWQTIGNTLFGYAAWGWLLQRHATAQVVPWALMVPVFGLASAVVLLDEPMPWWKWAAAALVMAGLALNVVGSTQRARRTS